MQAGLTSSNNRCDNIVSFIAVREQPVLNPHFGGYLRGVPFNNQQRLAPWIMLNPQLLPANPMTNSGPQGFDGGFFGSKTLGQKTGRIAGSLKRFQLNGLKNTL